MRRWGFGFAIKTKSQGFVNASDMRFSTYSDRELFRGIAVSRLGRRVNLGEEISRWDSEMLAQGTFGCPQSNFPLEAGLLPVVYQAGVDFV